MSAPEPAPPSRRRFVLPWEIWFFLLAFVALQFWQGREMQAGAMPPIAGQLADGRPVSLESTLRDAGGKPLLLYVWSSTCPICRAEEGTISALAEDWPVLTLAMQSGDHAAGRPGIGKEWIATGGGDGYRLTPRKTVGRR